MFCFVMNPLHSKEHCNGTAQRGKNQKRAFRYAPLVFGGTALVTDRNENRKNID